DAVVADGAGGAGRKSQRRRGQGQTETAHAAPARGFSQERIHGSITRLPAGGAEATKRRRARPIGFERGGASTPLGAAITWISSGGAGDWMEMVDGRGGERGGGPEKRCDWQRRAGSVSDRSELN